MTAPPGLPARAGRLFAAGQTANMDGRPGIAARKLRAALRLAAACDPEVRGRLLVSLAWAESERGRVDLGYRLLDQAQALLPPAGRAVVHAQRAVLLRRNGRNDRALPEFDRAVAGLADPLDLVKALNNRSLLHLDEGRVSAARDDLHRGLRISERHGFPTAIALIGVNLGCLDVVSGDLPAALGAFTAARADYERLVPGRLASLAIERSRALIAAGLFGEADRELAAAVDQATAQGWEHARSDALQVRAEAALLAGRPAAAVSWAAQARADFTRRGNRRRAALTELLALRATLDSLPPPRASTSTSPLGPVPTWENVAAAAGAEAIGAPSTSTSASPSGTAAQGPPGRGAEPGARPEATRPGAAAAEAGRAGDGMREAGRAGDGMREAGRAGDGMREVGRAGDGMRSAGRPGDGMRAAGRAGDGVGEAGRADAGGAVAGSRAEIAQRGRRLAGRLGRLGLAEDALVATLVAARAIAGEKPRVAARMVARAGVPGRHDRLDTRLLWRLARAEVAAAGGGAGVASRELAAGMATLHRYRGRFGCLDLQTGASAHGRDLARAGLAVAVADGRPGVVFRWSERVRAQALRLPPVRPPEDADVASALEDLRQTRQALRAAELAGYAAGGLRRRAESLQRRIRESAWSVRGALGTGAVVPLGAVRALLSETVLVSYIGGGERLHALVVSRSAVTVRALGPAMAAGEAVLRLRADLDTGAGRAMPARLAAAVGAATRRDAAAVQAAVLDPILDLVGDRALVVVPTGLLTTLPWGMLPGCAGRAVTVAPSATAWAAARERGPGGGRVVLVAGPEIRRGVEEIRAIAGIRAGARMLSGADATPAAVLAALDGAGLVHLAAHGRHEAENPLFSALDLAGGPLLGYDLPRLERAPDVVVLASCELGLTEVRPGDETLGMASALIAAGTATVVASVGRVADEPATDAMIGFHRALAAGHPPAEALAGVAAGTGFICLGT